MGLPALLISLAFAAELPERAAPASSSARVPRQLVEHVEKEYRRALKRPADEPIKLELLDVAVEVTAEKPGVVDSAARWTLPLGGGTLDLASVLGPKTGRFNVKLTAGTHGGENPAPPRVWFVPRGIPRELDGETFGDGCGKILELTRAFRTRFAARGLDAFSTGERHVATLSGTFLIAGFDQKGLQVGHVTFTDSRWPKLACGL